MNDVFLPTVWDWLAGKAKKNEWVSKDDIITELGLDLPSLIFFIKQFKENNLIKVQKNDNNFVYQLHLKLSPAQVSAANYIGIGMRHLQKYCTLNLKKEKDILTVAAGFDEYKAKQKKDLIAKMHKEKVEHKMANLQKTNLDLFALLSLADDIIGGTDKKIEKEIAKSIKKEIQSLVDLLAKE